MRHLPTPTDRDVVAALLRALDDGPVTIGHDPDLSGQGLASAYWPADGHVALNPDVSPTRQAQGLVHALGRLGRPALRVIAGGAA